jgi:hypothetical protein
VDGGVLLNHLYDFSLPIAIGTGACQLFETDSLLVLNILSVQAK